MSRATGRVLSTRFLRDRRTTPQGDRQWFRERKPPPENHFSLFLFLWMIGDEKIMLGAEERHCAAKVEVSL